MIDHDAADGRGPAWEAALRIAACYAVDVPPAVDHGAEDEPCWSADILVPWSDDGMFARATEFLAALERLGLEGVHVYILRSGDRSSEVVAVLDVTGPDRTGPGGC